MIGRPVAVVIVLVVSMVAVGFTPVSATDGNVTDIGATHGLSDASTISDYEADGVASADLTRLDMTVTVADSKADVGLEDELFPTDSLNTFLRFEYREEADRTVRILISEEYWTPYQRERVESLSDDTNVEFDTARGGAYTAVLVRFDGPADVVVPAEWVASFSYKNIERLDTRLDNSIGITLRDDDSEWQYVNSDDMAEGPGYDIGESVGDVTVQYDATPDSPEETWINAPQGETFADDIYYYQRDSENGSAYIVSKTDDPPTVRYNVDSDLSDRIRGDINELKNIPDRIREILGR